MKYQDKLKKYSKEDVWKEYCGFADLDISDYMFIQRRLMDEQLRVWCASGLGRSVSGGVSFGSIDEFRENMRLTAYEDYAEILLARRIGMLPAEPVVWIQTTWEGGLRPIKIAPYTRSMLDAYKHNVLSVMMLACAKANGVCNMKRGDRIIYGGAPLPYMTGLIPSLLDEEIDFVWLPSNDASSALSFSERIKKGFSLAKNGGVDFFFGIGSVANYITESFGKAGSSSSGSGGSVSAGIALKYLRAKYRCRRDGRALTPGDIFRLKGFLVSGTDAKCYKEALTRGWGVEPSEISAGTEATCIATETPGEEGMVFFPNSCFYEFIPETEMIRSLEDPDYKPRTCLMDEVIAGQNYELVISVFHGGAFMRYRIGDVYHCLSRSNGKLPRFAAVDRIPTVIDIAGFTRITESSVNEVIRLSKLGIGDWLAKKEYDVSGVPFLHMYIEMLPEAVQSDAVSRQVLVEHLSVYFKCFDSDYHDLKKLLGMEPLKVTILRHGAIADYQSRVGKKLSRINPPALDMNELLKYQSRPADSSFKEVKPR